MSCVLCLNSVFMCLFFFKGNQASEYKVGNRSWKNGHVCILCEDIKNLEKLQRNMAEKCFSLLQTWWKLLAKDVLCDRCKERASVDGFVRRVWKVLSCANREGFTHTRNRCSQTTGDWRVTGMLNTWRDTLLTWLEMPISLFSIAHFHWEGWKFFPANSTSHSHLKKFSNEFAQVQTN